MNLHKISLLVFILSISTSAQWYLQNSNTIENLNDVETLDYISESSAIIVGNNGTILKTTNSGNDWSFKNSGTSSNLNAVSFSFEDGIAVGDGVICLSTDEGESWEDTIINKNAISVINYFSADFGPIHLIGCDDGTIIYFTYFHYPWFDTLLTSESIIALGVKDNGLHISPLIFSTNSFTGISYAPLWEMSDWKIYNNPISSHDSLICGDFNSSYYQYLAGNGSGSESEILLLKKYYWPDTLWVPTYSNVSSSFIPEDIAVYYSSYLFICGSDGENWLEQNTGVNNKLNSILFGYNSPVGYSVGENGTILFTSNGGGINSVDDMSQPQSVYLHQNYPNPFNPVTKIKFEIPGQAWNDNALVTLKAYDVLGNEVATLVNEEKPAGEYEIEFSAVELPSGIYFYQLKAGNFVETKKMILLK